MRERHNNKKMGNRIFYSLSWKKINDKKIISCVKSIQKKSHKELFCCLVVGVVGVGVKNGCIKHGFYSLIRNNYFLLFFFLFFFLCQSRDCLFMRFLGKK